MILLKTLSHLQIDEPVIMLPTCVAMSKFPAVVFDKWEEAQYCQFCVIEKELKFVNMCGKIDLIIETITIMMNITATNTMNLVAIDTINNIFNNNINYYDENNNQNDLCYQCFIWRLQTRDLSRGGNHGGSIGIGDDTETILYAIGEPNERSYSRWQLVHIKNKSYICANFEEVLGIHQGNSNTVIVYQMDLGHLRMQLGTLYSIQVHNNQYLVVIIDCILSLCTKKH